MKSILIVCYSHLGSDPRVLRQFKALKENFDVHLAGYSPIEGIPSNKFIQIGNSAISELNLWNLLYRVYRKIVEILFLRIFFLPEKYYWDLTRIMSLRKLSKVQYDIILANDINTLPLAVSLKQQYRSKVYFDAHEFAPLEFENNDDWRRTFGKLNEYLCASYIPQTDKATTVGRFIAMEYQKLTGVDFDVVYNAPEFQTLHPLVVNPSKIRFVHHGAAIRSRKLELMIDLFKNLEDRFELNLIIVPLNSGYLEELELRASNSKNIRFHKPVATQEISRFINQFDISLIIIPPVNFNYRYQMGNKYFESIQARLMIISGGSVEAEEMIEKYKIGLSVDINHFKNLVKRIRNLEVTEIMSFKQNSDQVARKLSFEETKKKIIKGIEELCVE